MTEPSGAHFTQPGHNVSHLKGDVFEEVRNPDHFVLKSREHLLFKKFDSFRNGLNQEQWFLNIMLIIYVRLYHHYVRDQKSLDFRNILQ